jgi:two-component system, response regulator
MDHNSIEVLLVEDNAEDAELTTRELIKNHLANNLFHVKDGAEALDFIFARGKYAGARDIRYPPKIVLLDIQMPKVNGIEVLTQIKSNELTKMTPVIMLTSSKEDPDIHNSYIVKPVNFEGFAEAIKNLGFYWLLLNQPHI